jgi:effector-binding domain-containing protein
MLSEPTIIERQAQPYVSIVSSVTMQNIGPVLSTLHPEVFAWLGQQGKNPVGPPFWKYNVIDMEREMEVEVGVPTDTELPASGRIVSGVLPAGRYATLHHTGHPQELMDATRVLLEWADKENLTFDMTESGPAQKWASRLEIYNTDPREQPDMSKWETDLAFRLAD